MPVKHRLQIVLLALCWPCGNAYAQNAAEPAPPGPLEPARAGPASPPAIATFEDATSPPPPKTCGPQDRTWPACAFNRRIVLPGDRSGHIGYQAPLPGDLGSIRDIRSNLPSPRG